jgi:hypothetical protein
MKPTLVTVCFTVVVLALLVAIPGLLDSTGWLNVRMTPEPATWTVIDHTGREFEGCVFDGWSSGGVSVVKADGSRAMFFGNVVMHEDVE